jgi:hypothetical protein
MLLSFMAAGAATYFVLNIDKPYLGPDARIQPKIVFKEISNTLNTEAEIEHIYTAASAPTTTLAIHKDPFNIAPYANIVVVLKRSC